MEIANVFTVECDLGMEHDGFRIRETQIGPQLGADLIGGSVYDVDPGKKLWPYHLHHANEEWLVVPPRIGAWSGSHDRTLGRISEEAARAAPSALAMADTTARLFDRDLEAS